MIPGYDPAGLDTEDVQPLKNGLHIAADEYGKVIVFDSDGKIHVTYIPVGQEELGINETSTGSPVKAILPASFSFRRANRGLENLAVSGDKTRCYTCQQVCCVKELGCRGSQSYKRLHGLASLYSQVYD